MILTKIIDINDYKYTLEDNNKNRYELNIEFYDLKNKPKINNHIYISKKILNEKNNFSFGPLGGMYGKKGNVKEDELIKIITDNEEYYLQRYYG